MNCHLVEFIKRVMIGASLAGRNDLPHDLRVIKGARLCLTAMSAAGFISFVFFAVLSLRRMNPWLRSG
jgi:hypothetical protein